MTLTSLPRADSPSVWTADAMNDDRSWVYTLEVKDAQQLARVVRSAYEPEKSLFDYEAGDFDLAAVWPTVERAVREAYFGRGLALVKGLPRAELNEQEFELMSWAIGLHIGVARPQGKASQYLSAVRDVGTTYRAATGRGFSSNASLDFHVDGADITTLACYNVAKVGGESMVSSSGAAWNTLVDSQPEHAERLLDTYFFSRQGEYAPDEAPAYGQPVADFADGRLFMKWNRNRVNSAQEIAGVPSLTQENREAVEALDSTVRSPAMMFRMYLEPGDLQIMNNLDMQHSRTAYVDYEEPGRKRLLHRLWLAPPFSVRMPDTWQRFFRAVEPGAVRGGIRGHEYDDRCSAFDAKQAAAHNMVLNDRGDAHLWGGVAHKD